MSTLFPYVSTEEDGPILPPPPRGFMFHSMVAILMNDHCYLIKNVLLSENINLVVFCAFIGIGLRYWSLKAKWN